VVHAHAVKDCIRRVIVKHGYKELTLRMITRNKASLLNHYALHLLIPTRYSAKIIRTQGVILTQQKGALCSVYNDGEPYVIKNFSRLHKLLDEDYRNTVRKRDPK
jgi:hypothetical protein